MFTFSRICRGNICCGDTALVAPKHLVGVGTIYICYRCPVTVQKKAGWEKKYTQYRTHFPCLFFFGKCSFNLLLLLETMLIPISPTKHMNHWRPDKSFHRSSLIDVSTNPAWGTNWDQIFGNFINLDEHLYFMMLQKLTEWFTSLLIILVQNNFDCFIKNIFETLKKIKIVIHEIVWYFTFWFLAEHSM